MLQTENGGQAQHADIDIDTEQKANSTSIIMQVNPDVEADVELAEMERVPSHIISRDGTSAFPDFEIELENVNHFVPIKKGMCRKPEQKRLLFDVNATFVAGELSCLMGPSGAGKSTLLSVLALGENPGLKLNGGALPKKYSKMVSVIPQADILFPALTPVEALTYSALLRLPESTSKAEIKRVIDGLINDLNLVKCKDTPAGDETRRGISGGERKRVSIGTELVVNPPILLVDEPSSGLDSTAAEGVVKLLKRLSRAGQLVVCTIHQPSWGIFVQFDKLLLLHNGRVAYHGENKTNLKEYFDTLGFSVPQFENPMDFYLRVLQQQDDAEFFSSKWTGLDDDARDALDTSKRAQKQLGDGDISNMSAKNSRWFQFKTLFWRYVKDTLRDKEKFVSGFAAKLAVGLLLGIVFVGQARKDTNSSIFTSTSPLFFIVISSVFDTAFQSILTIPLTRPLLVREYRNGAFDISALFAAQVTSNLLFDTFSSLGYAVAAPIVGLFPSAPQMLLFILALSLMTVTGSALGLLLGTTSKDIKEAQGYMIPMVMPLLLFCGFLIPFDDIPTPFVWLYFISPFQWVLSSLLIVEFEDRTFTDDGFATGLEYLATQDLFPEDLARNYGIMVAINCVLLISAYFFISRAIKKQARES